MSVIGETRRKKNPLQSLERVQASGKVVQSVLLVCVSVSRTSQRKQIFEYKGESWVTYFCFYWCRL